MKRLTLLLVLALLGGVPALTLAQSTNAPASATNAPLPGWISEPMSLADALNIALRQNATILNAGSDLEATQGIIVQTRAVALPTLQATGQYKYTDPSAVENFGYIPQADQGWNSGIQLVQNIYTGGTLRAAFQAARAEKSEALSNYQATLSDTLLSVEVAYYDVLLAAQQITVNEASVNLLTKELTDQQSRYNAGTVPHFNVLQAEVALANARPPLIQARSTYRNDKNTLSNLLGYNLPKQTVDDIPLNLTDNLDDHPYPVKLQDAVQKALGQRPELQALRDSSELQRLNIIDAKAGYKPTVSVFAGYTWKSSQFTPPLDLTHDYDGWNAGGQISWNIFDGALTQGKITQAKALYQKSETTLADEARTIELEVRTAYSDFIEAVETLDSQNKVVEVAEEALREARARSDAGSGTQLDVLNAETSLTQSRTTQIQALHDYDTARARLERAIGNHLINPPAK